MTLCVRRAVARLSAALFLVAVVGCQTESVPRNVEITYRFHEGGCEGCASYELTFRERGIVQFRGLGGCAVHGEHEYRIAPADFATIRNALDAERFFSTRRIAQTGIIIDASVTRITYRDDRRIHETVDYGENPRLRRLATLLRRAGRAGRFISPTATVYEALLKSSWDPNVPHAADGWTALACAVVQGRADAVRLLLAHGARVRPLDLRIATLHPDVFSMLDGSSPIDPESREAASTLAAAARDDGRLLAYLLDRGVPVDAKDGGGRSALFAAIDGGQSPANARLLLSNGADPNLKDASGETPLLRAAVSANSGFIPALVASGARLEERDTTWGHTPLIRAASGCYYWNVEALLAAGADASAVNSLGHTALETARGVEPKCNTTRALLAAPRPTN